MPVQPETTTELAHRAPDAIQSEQASLLVVLERALYDKSVDVDKLERVLALAEKVRADDRQTAFRAAKARLAPKLPQIGKGGRILHGEKLISRYAKYEDIDRAIRPLLAEEGFSFSFDSEIKGTDIIYTAELSHRDGHAETKSIPVKADTSGAKNPIQAVGSSTSYARRMLVKMHLNLIECDEDDDGNGRNVAPITKEHVEDIVARIAEARNAGLAGFDEKRWLKWRSVTSFADLLERDYQPYIEQIKAMRARAEAERPA